MKCDMQCDSYFDMQIQQLQCLFCQRQWGCANVGAARQAGSLTSCHATARCSLSLIIQSQRFGFTLFPVFVL
ncbi:hypothetical protein J6590_014437 [Homalodisca vitripennis]|nr:hypothetical protein J6590_014437 [Homalodisca vitripennis]